jgi:hypothetical protein
MKNCVRGSGANKKNNELEDVLLTVSSENCLGNSLGY